MDVIQIKAAESKQGQTDSWTSHCSPGKKKKIKSIELLQRANTDRETERDEQRKKEMGDYVKSSSHLQASSDTSH